MKRLVQAMAVLLVFPCLPGKGIAQVQGTLDKDSLYKVSLMMLDARNEVKNHYYDPKLHGLDWDARYQEFSAMAAKAHNLGEAFRVVAAFLSGLDDSHVYLIPPSRANRYEDGYHFALVGDNCFITQIRPKSDAESQLHIGDQILTLDGFSVNRQDFHDIAYFLHVLSPMPKAQLVVRSPEGASRTVVVNHFVTQGKQMMDLTTYTADYIDLVTREENEEHADRSRMLERGDVAIWKLRHFDLDFSEIEHFIGIARKHKGLVLDLRGNGGGSVETLKVILGYLMDHDVKIADRVERKATKELVAKRQGNPFTGKLIVLVDSGSASASELLARLVQLEHRGTVVGDKTAGAVMESRIYEETHGLETIFLYAYSVTEANLIMADGKSLEKTGVTPDELLLPTGADLAAGRDPVLARAVDLAGGSLEAQEAGKLFPYEWPPR
jgi:carboxyl-terminal processing protease